MARARLLIAFLLLTLPLAAQAVTRQQAMADAQAYADSHWPVPSVEPAKALKCVKDFPSSVNPNKGEVVGAVYPTSSGCWSGSYYYFKQFPYDSIGPTCTGLSNLSGVQSWTGGNGEACMDGCGYEPVSQAGGTTIDGKSLWVTDSMGLKPTGQACGATTSLEPPGQFGDTCKPVPGQTLCVKADGSLCASASNGKKLCWTPGETGTKSTGDTLGIKQAGSQHTPPNLNLISGDTLVQDQATKGVTNTTIKDGKTTTINSNVTTYKTTNGTNAGTSDQADDSGKDKNGNSASGGGDCKTAPVVTGDAALGMIATQAWATRCAVEAGNSTKVTGSITDCSAGFSVEGDNAQAHALRAKRAELCGDGPSWSKVAGMSQDPGVGQTSEDIAGVRSIELSTGDLDGSGFGGGTCIGFAAVGSSGVASGFLQELASPPPLWCNFIAALKGVFVLVGAVAASYILTRSQ